MATEFGQRLSHALEHSKLTREQLQQRAGIAQSTLSAALSTGHGSRVTVQLAVACGVNPIWLATGDGEMLDPLIVQARSAKPASAAAPSLATALVDCLMALPPARWASVRAQLDQVVAHPEARDDVLAELQHLLQAPPEKRQANGR